MRIWGAEGVCIGGPNWGNQEDNGLFWTSVGQEWRTQSCGGELEGVGLIWASGEWVVVGCLQ